MIAYVVLLTIAGPQPAFTCSKFAVETLQRGVKYIQSLQ